MTITQLRAALPEYTQEMRYIVGMVLALCSEPDDTCIMRLLGDGWITRDESSLATMALSAIEDGEMGPAAEMYAAASQELLYSLDDEELRIMAAQKGWL